MSEKFLVTADKASADTTAAAIDAAIGHPTRGVNVGGGIHVNLDDPAKPGWTLTECQVVTAGDGTACVALTPLAVQQDGKTQSVSGKTVTIDVKSAAQTKPPKFNKTK